MAKGDKHNSLLSSLDEIRKGSQDEIPVEPRPDQDVRADQPEHTPDRPAEPAGLLDSLLSEVRAEAEREVSEITRTLEEKTQQERKLHEEEERKKKEQYERLIQDEARRRLQLVQRKEDEKRRKQEEAQRREQAKQDLLAREQRSRTTRKVLLAVSGVGVAAVAALVVLVLTGIIPLLPETAPVTSDETAPAEAVAPDTGPKKKAPETAAPGPAIGEPETEPPPATIDGPGGLVLDLPDRTDPGSIPSKVFRIPTSRTHIVATTMRQEVAKAFAHTSSGGGSKGSGDKEGTDAGGIKIDDSIFRD